MGPPFGIGEAGQHGDQRGEQIQADHGHNRTRQTVQAPTVDDADVGDIRPGKELAGGEQLVEALFADPLPAVDHHLPRPGHHAAKAEQADHGEVVKQLPQTRVGLGRFEVGHGRYR